MYIFFRRRDARADSAWEHRPTTSIALSGRQCKPKQFRFGHSRHAVGNSAAADATLAHTCPSHEHSADGTHECRQLTRIGVGRIGRAIRRSSSARKHARLSAFACI